MKKKPYRPDTTSPLPALPTLEEVKRRLNIIFPETFADRGILVGQMAARVVYVFLYGGFIDGSGRWLRPSYIYLFTEEQVDKTSSAARIEWISKAVAPKFRPDGKRWYSGDTSRETIRDDLMRNRLLELSVIGKRSGFDTTSSVPIYYLLPEFAHLFLPSLTDDALLSAIDSWRKKHLGEAAIQRMTLAASGAHAKDGDVFVDMPDGTRIRLSGGMSNVIVKGLIEHFTKEHMIKPMVLWVSASDKKSHPDFAEKAKKVGLEFDLNNELPDVILADLTDNLRIIMCEVVATDGAVTTMRRDALLTIARSSKIPEECFEFLSAFEDRSAAPFKKNFSQLALGTYVWFRTEPNLLVVLKTGEGATLSSV